MLKQWISDFHLNFFIEPDGPILIKSGLESPVDPSRPDMEFVRTLYQGRETVYIPGSSLKGVLRSHAERILKTLGPEKSCDIINDSCGNKLKEEKNSAKKYAQSCLSCKLFGTDIVLASRISFADCFPLIEEKSNANKTEQRAGVAIDRITQAVAHGPFFMEIVTQGKFEGKIQIHNFELWQLGLLGLTLLDLKEQRVFLGYGKSRGLGRIKITLQDLTISYNVIALGKRSLTDSGKALLYGLGSLVAEKEYEFEDTQPLAIEVPFQLIDDFLRKKLSFQGDEPVWKVFNSCAQKLVELKS